MPRKKKVTEEAVETTATPQSTGPTYEYYDDACLVIHCNKCNKLTHVCTQDAEGNIVPIVVSKALDLTKLFGGPMPTDNHSQFPLFCDTCKTMLTLRFAPVIKEDAEKTEEVKVEPKLEIVK